MNGGLASAQVEDGTRSFGTILAALVASNIVGLIIVAVVTVATVTWLLRRSARRSSNQAAGQPGPDGVPAARTGRNR